MDANTVRTHRLCIVWCRLANILALPNIWFSSVTYVTLWLVRDEMWHVPVKTWWHSFPWLLAQYVQNVATTTCVRHLFRRRGFPERSRLAVFGWELDRRGESAERRSNFVYRRQSPVVGAVTKFKTFVSVHVETLTAPHMSCSCRQSIFPFRTCDSTCSETADTINISFAACHAVFDNGNWLRSCLLTWRLRTCLVSPVTHSSTLDGAPRGCDGSLTVRNLGEGVRFVALQTGGVDPMDRGRPLRRIGVGLTFLVLSVALPLFKS